MNTFKQRLRRTPLIRRVVLSTFIFSSVLSSVVIACVFYSHYTSERELLRQCLNIEFDRQYDPLAQAIWESDKDKIINHLGVIEDACRVSGSKPFPYFWQLNLLDEQNWLQDGRTLLRWPVLQDVYPISYWEGLGAGQYGLAELRVSVSLESVYDELLMSAGITLSAILLIMMLSAVFSFLLASHYFLKRSSGFMDSILNGDISEPLRQSIAQESSELADLWRVLLRLRNEFDEQVFELRKELRSAQGQVEDAKHNLTSKNQFISSLSHELRTPMNGLIGFSSLLAETELNQVQREYVSTIQASLESLLHVINDVADLAKIESGELNVDSIPFSIRGVVSGVSGLLRVRAESKGVRMETRVAPDIPYSLRGDPARLRQILSNLVGSSITHTSKGHILLNVDLVREDSEDCVVRLSVEDSGNSARKRLRQSEAQDRSAGSIGSELGSRLTITQDACEKLASLLGADLVVEDIYNNDQEVCGVTTWFELTLPVLHAVGEPTGVDLSELSSVLVIVIDSSGLSRRITLEMLESWNIEFAAFSSVAEALEQMPSLMSKSYTAVLLDDRPAGTDVYSAARKIRATLGVHGGLVILSSHPQLGDAERYYLAGASGFLSKQYLNPFLRDVLCQVYAERDTSVGENRRLVTRYTVQDFRDENSARKAHKYHALVVEDNIVNQQLLTRELDKKGCQVDIATNGFEALELFKHNRYDLVLMDCMLQDMDGYETTQIIREIEHSKKWESTTPVIALTDTSLDDEEARCKRAGMTSMLDTPIRITQLEMVLERFIG